MRAHENGLTDGLRFQGSDHKLPHMAADKNGDEKGLLDIEECRAFLLEVVERSLDAVVMVDVGGGLLEMNEAARGLAKRVALPAGRSSKDPLSIPFFDREGNPIDEQDAPLTLALREKRPVEQAKLGSRTKDGGILPISASAYPVRSDDGEMLGAVAFYRDVSHLLEKERLREEWRSVVSHDLRGPVVTVDLAAKLLLDDPALEEEEEARELVVRVARAATRLDEMIQNLTDSALVETGRVRLQPEEVDIEEAIECAVDSLEIPEDRKLSSRIESGGATVFADPDRLERVLHNLIHNAVVHGRTGTPIGLDVEVEGDETIVSITSRGAGVPPEVLPRVFDRFFKRPTWEGPPWEGLGLGLFVAKGMVEAHGGRIWAESSEEGPTVFRFSLPSAASSR